MSKKNLRLFGGVALVVVLIAGLVLATPLRIVSAYTDGKGGPGGRGGTGTGTGSTGTVAGVATTPLSDTEKDALTQAILEEYGALNLYNGVIAEFGNVTPFYRIAKAEQQHVNSLIKQATKYGVTIPENSGLSEEVSFGSLSEACSAGAAAEITDAALYDELKPITSHTDILQVYTTLQNASLNSHLPAFQLCD